MSCTFSHCRLIIYYCPICILSKSVHTLSYHNNILLLVFIIIEKEFVQEKKQTIVKNSKVSGSQEVDLVFLIFFSHFYFLFNLFSFILFLELELGLEWQDHAVTQQVTSRWHSHKLHDTWKDIKHSGRNNVIQYMICMLPLGNIHGHLG